jgi:Tfp pilus assembly protein PilV
MVKSRRVGLSLIEALMALAVFGAGVLGIAGAASRAIMMLREAESLEGARAAMLSVADSLTQFASPVSGSAMRGRYALAWTVVDSGVTASIVVRVLWVNGTRARSDSVSAVAAPAPARLHVVP